MGVLDAGGDCQREGSVFGVNLGRPIVTNGDFATKLFPNYLRQDLFTFSASCVIITTQCYTSAVYAVVMCLSVHPSHTGIVLKWLNLGNTDNATR